MQSARRIPPDIVRDVLAYVVFGSIAGMGITTLGPLVAGAAFYPVRLVSFIVFGAAALLGRARGVPSPGSVLLLIYAWWWLFPLVEPVVGRDLGYGSRTTMAVLLMMLAIIIPSLVVRRPRKLAWVLAATGGLHVAVTGAAAGVDAIGLADQVVSMVMGGLLGYSIVGRYISRVWTLNDLQRSLAECSRSLLAGPEGNAIEEALSAIASFRAAPVAFIRFWRGPPDCEQPTATSNGAPQPAIGLIDEVFATEVARSTIRHGGPLRIGLVANPPHLPSPAAAGYAGLYAVPVTVDGTTVGAIGVLAARPGMSDMLMELLYRASEMLAAHLYRAMVTRRLERLIESKDEFVAAVSHELRTPLTAVVGLSAELQRSGHQMASPERAELISIIATQSREVGDLVEDLLVAARADVGTLALALDSVDLRDEVDGVAAGLAASLEGKTLAVRGHASCHADPLRVRQIVRNLLSNAVRYGGATITVHLDSSDGCGRIVVADDGDGIPADAVDSIFETYTRAHSSAVHPGSVGIGLAVSRRLARLMGGDVVYEAGPPTAFVLTLPASSPILTTAAARPPLPIGLAGPQPN